MAVIIHPSTPNLTVTTIDSFLLKVAQNVRPSEHVTLDLRQTQFIDLFAMIVLLYCCDKLTQRHRCRVRLEVADDNAGRFLPRAGFFNVLNAAIEVSNTFTPARLQWENALRGDEPKLIELTPIDSGHTISNILDQLINILRYRLFYSKYDAFDLAIVFSELCHNILDHNTANSNGLSAMQLYTSAKHRFMQFVVADQGAGILNTLQRNPQYADLRSDLEGIAESMTLGASEHSDATRGNGLYHLVQLATKHGGNIHIRSGRGKIYIRTDGHIERRLSVPHLTGTQISITFPAHTRKTG